MKSKVFSRLARKSNITYFYLIDYGSCVKYGATRDIKRVWRDYTSARCKDVLNKTHLRLNKASQLEVIFKRVYAKNIKQGTKEFIENVSYDELVKFMGDISKYLVENRESELPKDILVALGI